MSNSPVRQPQPVLRHDHPLDDQTDPRQHSQNQLKHQNASLSPSANHNSFSTRMEIINNDRSESNHPPHDDHPEGKDDQDDQDQDQNDDNNDNEVPPSSDVAAMAAPGIALALTSKMAKTRTAAPPLPPSTSLSGSAAGGGGGASLRLGEILHINRFLAGATPKDENLIFLHRILYNGGSGKENSRKTKIRAFAGFDFATDADRLKVYNRMIKMPFNALRTIAGTILDLPGSGIGTKKDKIVQNVLEFLIHPHRRTVQKVIKKKKKKDGPADGASTTPQGSKDTNSKDPKAKAKANKQDAAKKNPKRQHFVLLHSTESEDESQVKTDLLRPLEMDGTSAFANGLGGNVVRRSLIYRQLHDDVEIAQVKDDDLRVVIQDCIANSDLTKLTARSILETLAEKYGPTMWIRANMIRKMIHDELIHVSMPLDL